jgi:hypothetical protein
VSRDEVYKAVLAFLDQFISRGAALDIHDLRQRLANDPEARQSLERHLDAEEPTEREAFDAMTAFFAAEWERGGGCAAHAPGSPDLIELISWTSWDLGDPADPASQATGDPAQWHDWLSSVETTRQR